MNHWTIRISAFCGLLALLAANAFGATAPAQARPTPAPTKAAAILAVKHSVAAQTGRKTWTNGPIRCVSPGGSSDVWMCLYRGGSANVLFRQLRGVWKTTVFLH